MTQMATRGGMVDYRWQAFESFSRQKECQNRNGRARDLALGYSAVKCSLHNRLSQSRPTMKYGMGGLNSKERR